MDDNRTKNGQDFCSGGGMSAALGEMVLDHIETKYAPLRFATEKLARVANVRPASARNWMRRLCTPQVENLGELIRNDPEFRAKLLAWIEQQETP